MFPDPAVDGEMAVSTPTVVPGGTLRIAESGSSVLTVGSLNLEPPDAAGDDGGVLDLFNEAMNAPNTAALTIQPLLAAGYDGGRWDGGPAGGGSPAAILSSAAAADPYAIHALGYEQVGTGAGTWSPAVPFAGTTVNAGDTVVMYTYDGDAYLDGTVDGTDFTRIDNGLNNGLTGWGNGDFNYTGGVTETDEAIAEATTYFDVSSSGSNANNLPGVKVKTGTGGNPLIDARNLPSPNSGGSEYVEITKITWIPANDTDPTVDYPPSDDGINVNRASGQNGSVTDPGTDSAKLQINVSDHVASGRYLVYLNVYNGSGTQIGVSVVEVLVGK